MKRLMIIFGGVSSEHDISCQSAKAVIMALAKRYELIKVYIDHQGAWYLFTGDDCLQINHDQLRPLALELSRSKPVFKTDDQVLSVDKAFIVMHGSYGEDGRLQGMLEMLKIKVVGCNSVASMLGMHKDLAKKIVGQAGIKTASFRLLKPTTDLHKETFKYPLFVKPNKQGSSFGISKVATPADLPKALAKVWAYDDEALVEEYIDGWEVGCAIMGKDQLTIGEVDILLNVKDYFSYEEKYHDSAIITQVPAMISKELTEQIKTTALAIYRLLKCEGFARIDMFLTSDHKIYFNEINTIPGLTDHSRFPGMFKAAGLSFANLLERIVEDGNNC
ncbi:MAG: D-alanine--D-alanine ligase [Erysipelotrichaceae bacterium]|nr:D-alanine--D-alanine ligase [Erysipelotrichaceae bacterium]MDY5252648.1 D-alanine--D-alanine ligase family protein [Erysipelotrichaceae bacterium]